MTSTFPPTTEPAVKTSVRPQLLRILLTTGILLTLALSLFFVFPPKIIHSLTNKTTDLLLKTTSGSASAEEIVIVAIDEPSLQTYGQWPWPRSLIARLLKIIGDAGATAIGINILFPEKDRTSPAHGETATSAELFDHDLMLAKSFATEPVVAGYEFLFDQFTAGPAIACPMPPQTLFNRQQHSPETVLNLHRAKDILCNYMPLAQATKFAGFLNGAADDDGVLRRLPLLVHYREQFYPSFALAVLMKHKNLQVLTLEPKTLNLPTLSFGGRKIYLQGRGNILLGPAPLSRPHRLSAVDLLGNTTYSQQLRQKIVLVGTTAQGLSQSYPTPYSAGETLLDIHAAAIGALSSGVQTLRPPILPSCEALISILLCLGLAPLCIRCSAGWSAAFCLSAAVAVWFLARLLLQQTGLLFSPLLPTTCLVLNGFLFITLKFRYFQLQAKAEKGDALLLLKSSESSLRSILHTVPDIIFRLDPEGKIVFISPAICRYTNSAENLLGKSIFSYVAPSDLERARFRLNERRTGERATFDLEIRLLLTREDATTPQDFRFFSVSAEGLYQSDVPNDRGFLGTQGLAKDITDRKKLEQQLLQAQKMEVIGNLAAGIAHDLNNILSGLVSYPDLLLLEIPKDNPLHAKIATIRKSGQKAAAIVQDLLCMARRSITETTLTNLNLIIEEYLNSAEYLQLQARYPQVAVVCDLDARLWSIEGSNVHLSKVVMNLLHNAMEAIPANGKIILATGNIDLHRAIEGYEHIPAGIYVCLSVCDNGTGISQADLPKIFEPFFSRKTMHTSGTGLGMTIIWATIKDHRGYVDIHSREGHGTTFNIYLPATRETAALPDNRPVLEDYLGSGSILVVDDVPEQLQLAKNMLEKLGYSVETAESGETAVAMTANQSFDLIILDMIMPGGMNGLETYAKIIAIHPGQKAIITSGYSKSEHVGEMQTLGAGIFVQKPYSLERLGMAVKTTLAKTPVIDDK